jgi:hypothetical protein
METNQPNWQPLSMLPLITNMIDEALDCATEQLKSLYPTLNKPHVLDSDTVNRIVTVYTEQAEDHWVLEEQLLRWKNEASSKNDVAEINRLSGVLADTKVAREKILGLASAIESNTIDKILDMDDAELAAAMLSGNINL